MRLCKSQFPSQYCISATENWICSTYSKLGYIKHTSIQEAWCPHTTKTPESRWAHRSLQSVHYFSIVRVTSSSPPPPEPPRLLPSTPLPYPPYPGAVGPLAPFFYHSSLYFRMQIILHTCENRNHCSRFHPHGGPWWRNLFLQHLHKCLLSKNLLLHQKIFRLCHIKKIKILYFSYTLPTGHRMLAIRKLEDYIVITYYNTQ